MPLDDPSAVHPEHDELTPENSDDWSEEQAERYTDLKEATLEDDAQQNRRELAAEEREALDALREATQDDEPLTATVEFGDAELIVTKKVTGELEQKFDRITEEQEEEYPKIANIKDAIIDAILLVLEDDDEPADDPVDFQSREIWERYYEKEGSAGLMEVFETVAEPALQRYERLGNSHGRARQ